MSRFAFVPQALACVVGIALLLVNGVSAFAQVDPSEIGLEFDLSEPALQLNSRFRPRQGWIGGDGAQSVDLGNHKTLWLYGDTWVGTVKEGRRSKARIIHNSAGIQCGPEEPCDFIVRENAEHKPVDLITPEDGRGWFWFQAGVMVHDRLYLFMSQVDRSKDVRRPEHMPLGQWLGIVENPHDDPRDWCVDHVKIPYSVYSRNRDLTFGAGTVISGDHLYVYGSDDASRLHSQDRFLVVARVPLDKIAQMSEWRFLRRGRWGRNHVHPTRIANYMASDLSVTHLSELNQYLMVYTDCDISNRIVARTAPTPVGPWSDIQMIHACRDSAGDSKLFCYAGKAHPTLSSNGQLVISYLTSSVDTWQVAMDSRLYWPTFVTVGIRDARPPDSAGTIAKAGQSL